ncbi:MAG TPA: HAD-IIIA family hydrolase [Burkholderiales bacterium]|nr:HAD-IIIA family hydrolase [Burkholderiales bacterium]
MQEIYERARRIRIAAFDVDGVLTDGTLRLADAGEEIKAFNALDGHGLKLLRERGVALAIVSSRSSRAVEARARGLGIELLYQGVCDKLAAFEELLARARVAAEHCAFAGDDVLDLPVLERCGLAITVPDAPAAVRRRAHYVTRARGGRGAVREACDLVLYARGTPAWRTAGHCG